MFGNKSSVSLLADVFEKGLTKSNQLEKNIPSFFVYLPGFTWEAGFTYTKTQKCNWKKSNTQTLLIFEKAFKD